MCCCCTLRCAIRLAPQHLKSNYSAGARKLDAECPFGQRHDCDTCTAPVRYSFRTCSCCASKRVRFQSCASKLPEPCSNLSIFSLCRAVVPAARARAKNCNIRPDERTLENLTIFCSIAQARIGQLSLVVCPTTQKCLSSRVAYCMHGPTFSSLCGLVVSKRPKAAELQSGKDHRGSSISVARG